MTHAAERYASVTDIKIVLAAVAVRVLAGAVAGIGFGAYSAWDYYARTGDWRGAIRCGRWEATRSQLLSSAPTSVGSTQLTTLRRLSFIPIYFWRCGG